MIIVGHRAILSVKPTLPAWAVYTERYLCALEVYGDKAANEWLAYAYIEIYNRWP